MHPNILTFPRHPIPLHLLQGTGHQYTYPSGALFIWHFGTPLYSTTVCTVSIAHIRQVVGKRQGHEALILPSVLERHPAPIAKPCCALPRDLRPRNLWGERRRWPKGAQVILGVAGVVVVVVVAVVAAVAIAAFCLLLLAVCCCLFVTVACSLCLLVVSLLLLFVVRGGSCCSWWQLLFVLLLGWSFVVVVCSRCCCHCCCYCCYCLLVFYAGRSCLPLMCSQLYHMRSTLLVWNFICKKRCPRQISIILPI